MGFFLASRLLLGFCAVSVASAHFVVHESRTDPLPRHSDRRRLHPDVLLPVRLGLKSNEKAILNAEAWLMQVSHPDSPAYGNFWSSKDVHDAFRPTSESVDAVTSWLSDHGLIDYAISENHLWLTLEAPVGKLEEMLLTEYYKHMTDSNRFEASCDEYSLPSHIRPYVDYITPGVSISDITGRSERSRSPQNGALNGAVKKRSRRRATSASDQHVPRTTDSSLEDCYRAVSPACIRALYNITEPDPKTPVNKTNALGLYENLDTYYQGDLDLLYQHFAPNIPNGTSPIYWTIDGNLPPVTNPNSKDSDNVLGETELDLEVAIPLIYPQNVTIFEVVVNQNNQTTVFDDFFAAIDASYCTPAQRNNSAKGGKPRCGIYKPSNVMSFSYSYQETVSPPSVLNRVCNEFLKLGLQGISIFVSSGDTGVDGATPDCPKDPAGPRVFQPAFPASCPWVTSVGATEIPLGHTVQQPEVAANWYYRLNSSTVFWDGSSGGGFSIHFPRPDYQNEAVSSYFQKHNPPWRYFQNGSYQNSKGRYNRNGRGIPDLSAVGTNLPVYDLGAYGPVNGTSASTPVVASAFNLIVEERLRAGKKALGFINPTLYKNADALTDITQGGNGLCGPNGGFQAVQGWDPVTGLGTPKFSKLMDVFLNLP